MASIEDEVGEMAALIPRSSAMDEDADGDLKLDTAPAHTSASAAAYGKRAPFRRKFAFALGGFMGMSTHTVVGFFLAPFLLEVAGISPYIVSICTFLGRAWDAVTDPTVGHFVNKTRSRWGMLRPWMMFGAFPCLACYFAIWIVPPWPMEYKAAYYILMYLAYQLFFSMFQVPYTSLTMHISPEPKDRDQATTYRMLVEGLAVMMGAVVQGFIVDGITNPDENHSRCNCSLPDGGKSQPFVVNQSAANGYMVAAAAITALGGICSLIVVLGVPEDKSAAKLSTKGSSFFKNFLSVCKSKSYMFLTMMFLWAWMANNVNQSNYILWLKYGFGREAEFKFLLLTLLCTTFVSTPFWYWLMVVIGKKYSFMLGLAVQLPWTIAQFFLPEDVPTYVLHLGICSASVGVGAVYLLPWAMLPDVIDEAHLRTGKRPDSVYYSFFVFFQKFGSGIAIALSTLALQYSGYSANECCKDQPSSLRTTLKYLASVAPGCLLLISLIFTSFYKLSPARCFEIKRQLKERRDAEHKEQERQNAGEKAIQRNNLVPGRNANELGESQA